MPVHVKLLLAAAVTLGGAAFACAETPGGPPAHHPGMPMPGFVSGWYVAVIFRPFYTLSALRLS